MMRSLFWRSADPVRLIAMTTLPAVLKHIPSGVVAFGDVATLRVGGFVSDHLFPRLRCIGASCLDAPLSLFPGLLVPPP